MGTPGLSGVGSEGWWGLTGQSDGPWRWDTGAERVGPDLTWTGRGRTSGGEGPDCYPSPLRGRVLTRGDQGRPRPTSRHRRPRSRLGGGWATQEVGCDRRWLLTYDTTRVSGFGWTRVVTRPGVRVVLGGDEPILSPVSRPRVGGPSDLSVTLRDTPGPGGDGPVQKECLKHDDNGPLER